MEIIKEKATILAGGMKIQVPMNNLVKIKKEKNIQDNFVKLTIANPSIRLDIRGQKPEEAEFEVIKFIDDAYVSGLSQIEILHGKGTGALKEACSRDIEVSFKSKRFPLCSN